MKKLALGAITVASLSLLMACQTKKTENTSTFNQSVTQTIDKGKIEGKKDKDKKVLEWLGVPYAQAKRWQEPKEVNKWKGTFKASNYGDKDIQFSNDKVVGKENALNLDVVRPDTKKTKLPVIVYIHGGNNQTGNAQEIKGNTFVKDINAVYVSVNYRLGVFGFNPLEAVKTGSDNQKSGNFSLLDIAKALDWVKENIETFGGDKDNVTLSGFSAGGRDVMAALISPTFKGKFNKAISFSGGMTLSDMEDSQNTFAAAIASLVVEDGIKSSQEEAKSWLLTKGSDVANYLKTLSADRLAKLMGNAAIRMAVFPHLYKDGTVLPSEGFDTKNYNDVPLMLVSGTNEFSFFAANDNRFAKDFTSGELFKDSQKQAEYNYVRKYGGQLYRLSNTVESTRLMADKYKSNIYVSQISYGDNADVTPQLAPTFGAFHGIFEPMLQSPSNYTSFIGQDFNNDGAAEMSANFKAYLKNFLATGNPNGNDLSKWPAWTKKDNVLSITASKKKAEIKATTDTETAEDILTKLEADTSLSEDVKEDLNKNVLNGRWFSSVIDEKYNNQ
ncbi:carboxylesterase family protein [Streptococcus orisasini]|uniref:carboxylesterase family protein n=1 Tax=Streptococcus orisasini TaxID=1080071 RepID=UPI0007092C57|nr:carboxylesterase family protein [Streptococcus orisasini]